MVQQEHVKGNKCKVPVLCRSCNNIWWVTISNHINHKTGCPDCYHSKGELACKNILSNLGLTYQSQARLPLLASKRYDFAFTFNNRIYILEFDGQQHFEYNDFFHRDPENFKEHQQVDILKTYTALHSGCCVIRIDYSQIDNIEYHIRSALNNNYLLYVTNISIYKYILDGIQNQTYIF